MKRLCLLAALMAIGSSAHAGGSISFTVRGHRVHIESSRYCRSLSCASVSVSRSIDGRSKRDRFEEDGGDAAVPAKAAPQIVSPPSAPPPVATPPAPAIASPPPAVYRPAASETKIVATPPAPPPVQPVSIPSAPPPIAKPTEAMQPAQQVSTVVHEAEQEPADSPVGDWQTEAKGTVRIAKCGNALCGYVLSSPSNDRGEAVLINMKPKTDQQWSGSVYSQDSGETYYGTMSMKGINTLRVEACVLGRFYCSGNSWSRITRRADGLMTSRQVPGEPRI